MRGAHVRVLVVISIILGCSSVPSPIDSCSLLIFSLLRNLLDFLSRLELNCLVQPFRFNIEIFDQLG